MNFLRRALPTLLGAGIRRYSRGMACSACGAAQSGDCGLSLIKCSSCRAILPLAQSPPANYYALFCVPPVFTVNLSSLRHQYLKLQRILHPDNFPLGTDAMRTNAEHWSAHLNRAYESLKDPFKRAIHLYELGSGSAFETEGTIDAKEAGPAEKELLAEVMDLRVALEDCQEPQQARSIIAENEQRIHGILAKLGDLFSRQDLEAVRAELIKLRYWRSVDSVARDVLEDLDKCT